MEWIRGRQNVIPKKTQPKNRGWSKEDYLKPIILPLRIRGGRGSYEKTCGLIFGKRADASGSNTKRPPQKRPPSHRGQSPPSLPSARDSQRDLVLPKRSRVPVFISVRWVAGRAGAHCLGELGGGGDPNRRHPRVSPARGTHIRLGCKARQHRQARSLPGFKPLSLRSPGDRKN